MNDIERQIIGLLENNQYLSEDLRKRYILALFLMTDEKQKEFLKLVQGLDRRTKEADDGFFILRTDEAGKLKNDFDEVKRDILKKIQQKNNHKKI